MLRGAYVRAFKGLDGFRREARFGTWLARTVINEALACARWRNPIVNISLIAVRTGGGSRRRSAKGLRTKVLNCLSPDPLGGVNVRIRFTRRTSAFTPYRSEAAIPLKY